MVPSTSAPAISIVMPVLNERDGLDRLFCRLPVGEVEIIVADGGSEDGTLELLDTLPCTVVNAERGRARQMNAGARAASGDVLIFLHADTRLPEGFIEELAAFHRSRLAWGRFDVRLSGEHPMLRIVEFMMNFRSRITGIATGDQAIFVERDAFEKVDGYPDIALMEDIGISSRLKRLSRPWCSRKRVTTASRRWEEDGMLPTILLMWRLRLAYWLGAAPEALARRYHRSNRP